MPVRAGFDKAANERGMASMPRAVDGHRTIGIGY
jgi:hypothetical protein